MTGLVSDESGKLNSKDRDARYIVGPIWHMDKKQYLICHFSTLTMQSMDKINGEILFTLKIDMVFELQSKAANHVNRLGTQLLK